MDVGVYLGLYDDGDRPNPGHRVAHRLWLLPGGADLDIPALAFTRDQARNKRGLLRWIAMHQAALFFPLLLLEGGHAYSKLAC